MQRTSVALYARVSTHDQDCAMQIRELRAYAKRHNWKVARIYIDTGWTRAKSSRPEFDKLKADAAQRHFDAVAVWKLDRFGCSVRDCLNALHAIHAHKVRFVATSQGIEFDPSNPIQMLNLHILAAVSEFEREMIRERVLAGLRNARAKGVQLGRKRAVFDRERAREMRAGGASYRTIARACGVGIGTAHRILA
jgi:putative DNA-invertase from lambdoid prophage Rac